MSQPIGQVTAESLRAGQRRWANSQGKRLERGRTARLEENLCEAPEADLKAEFGAGRGQELRWKMRSVHSSSALVVNVFYHWRKARDASALLSALGLSSDGFEPFEFERKLKVWGGWTPPHCDVFFAARPELRFGSIAVESKFTEPFSHKPDAMPCGYLEKGLLDPFKELARHARSLPRKGQRVARVKLEYRFLDTKQLVAHILGLQQLQAQRDSGVDSTLVYLYYDVPGSEDADQHRLEIRKFAEIAHADSIQFKAVTYQSMFEYFQRTVRREHAPYVDYLIGRYGRNPPIAPPDSGAPPR